MLACRPMLPLTAALIAGVVCERYFPCFAVLWPYALIAAALCVAAFLLSPPRPPAPVPENLPPSYRRYIFPVPGFFALRGLNRFMLVLCLLLFIVGMGRQYVWRRSLDAERLPAKRWFNARLIARAPSRVHPDEDGFITLPAYLVGADGEDLGRLPVQLRCDKPGAFRRGDLLYGRVRKSEPSRPAFPGAFDYGFFLERDGLIGSLRVVKSRGSAEKLAVTPVDNVSPLQKLYRAMDDIRGWAIRQTLRYGGSQGGLLAAMLFGYRKDIGVDVRDAFRRVGIGHVLAISGLHVGLVVGMLWWLGGWIGWRARWRALFCLALALFYWGLTGGQVAATRATLMAAIHLAGIAGGRRGDMLNSLGAAAFFITLANPSAPVDVSFQLSFIAVVFIYIGLRNIPAPEPERRTADPVYNSVFRRRIVREVAGLSILSVATWVGLFPIIALVFKQVNLAGLPINIVVIPLMSLVLAGGLLLPWFGWIPGVGWLCTLPSRILVQLADFVDKLPGSSFPAHPPGLGWVFLFYLSVVALLLERTTPVGRFRRRWMRAAYAGLAVALFGVIFSMRSLPPPEKGRIAVLPGVGMGVAAAESPDGGIALVGNIRRGGLNEVAWLHHLHRSGPVAVLAVGNPSLGALGWHYKISDVTVLPDAAAEWTPVPGASGVEYSLSRDPKGKLTSLRVRTGDKTVDVVTPKRKR